MLGTPITSPLSFADWNDDFSITCPTCPDGCCPGGQSFTSIYLYDESQAGVMDATAKYVAISNITDVLTTGQGYWVYLGNGFPSTTSMIFDVSGSVAKAQSAPLNVPISYTSHGSTQNDIDNDGWNLISNPLPSPISWAALKGSTSNIDDAIYVYNAHLNNGVGAFASYVSGTGVSSPALGSGGIGDVIPMCQAFYVHSTGATALTALETNKINANPDFLRMSSNAVTNYVSVARLFLDNGNQHDESAFYFDAAASVHFEKQFDAYKILNDPSQPYIAGISDGQMLSISGLPQGQTSVVPVKAIVTTTGTFTITLGGNPPIGICINLYDTYTGVTTNLSTSDYVCVLNDTTKGPRFTITFGSTPLAATTTITQPSCNASNSGLITAIGNNNGPWNYTWRDVNGAIIKASLNKSTADSLNQLSGGDYAVEINTVGQCDNYTEDFILIDATNPIAQFTKNAISVSAMIDTVFFYNSSINSTSWFWNFGDGNSSTNKNPMNIYASSGIYTVSLVAYNNACSDTTSQIVTVSGTNGILETAVGGVFIHQSESGATVSFNLPVETNVVINLFNINGSLISSENVLVSKENKDVWIPTVEGVYLVQVIDNNKSIVKKIFR